MSCMKKSARMYRIMQGIDIPYNISYRNIKYPRLEFRTGKLLLILPQGSDPDTIISKHQEWINKKYKFIQDSLKEADSRKIVKRLDSEFRNLISRIVDRTTKSLNVKINNIFYRTMKTKWASCSVKKNLNVNKMMQYLPEKSLEYIIYHEIVHLFEKRHNERFWKMIVREFPEYREIEKELFVYWFRLVGHDPGDSANRCDFRKSHGSCL